MTSLVVNMVVDLHRRWRWDASRSDLVVAWQIHQRSLNTVQALTQKRGELSETGDFTAEGLARQLRDWIKRGHRADLIQAAGRIESQREQIAERRQTLSRPVIASGDTVSEMQRREIRDFLRSLPAAQRASVALQYEEVAEAVLAAPAILSGLQDEVLKKVATVYAERQHAEQLKQLEDLEEAVEVAAQALNLAVGQAKEASGLHETGFALWWASGQEPDGQSLDGQSMPRAKFDALPQEERTARVREGVRVVDAD